MSQSHYQRLIEFVARKAGALLMPTAARLHEEEVASGAFGADGNLPETIRVEDRGADTTIFSFSSAGFLHSGLPTFAFEGLFNRQPRSYNLVFLRDIHRLAYHLTPDGKPTGLAYYESEVRDIMGRLGARRNLAIGESSGAAAALHFGTCCQMDQVICFAIPYPVTVWTSPSSILRTLTNFPELIRDPPGYWDALMITSFSILAEATLKQKLGPDGIFDPPRTYLEAKNRPELTLVFGQRCHPDASIAARLKPLPEVKLRPLPTGRHILWVPIARMGSLERLIMDEIEGGEVPPPGA